ncbi:hypothetical protein KP509_25G016600 [Ceratopteris richardii]|uniref:Uncharacterized protein n=1 Tax=Ceratopteris richardii TaxID=49495 RepID=A0A8T2RR00_CERRI|nr:hypothetical protein KP509_25G016600 [Ceratopteris richardii]
MIRRQARVAEPRNPGNGSSRRGYSGGALYERPMTYVRIWIGALLRIMLPFKGGNLMGSPKASLLLLHRAQRRRAMIEMFLDKENNDEIIQENAEDKMHAKNKLCQRKTDAEDKMHAKNKLRPRKTDALIPIVRKRLDLNDVCVTLLPSIYTLLYSKNSNDVL